jgi:CHAT domain-containing protein
MNWYIILFLLFLGFNLSAQDILFFPDRGTPASEQPFAQSMKEAALLAQTIEQNPEQCTQLTALAKNILQNGEHELAQQYLKQIVDIKARQYGAESLPYANALVELNRAYILLIRYQQAMLMYEEALAIYEKKEGVSSYNYRAINNEYAAMLLRGEQSPKSLSIFTRTLALSNKARIKDPALLDILHNNIGSIYIKTQQFERAQNSFQKLLNKNLPPRNQIALHANLAELFALQKKYKQAERQLVLAEGIAQKHLCNGNDNYARVWVHLAEVYHLINRPQASLKNINRALVANSTTYTSIENIAHQANDLLFKNRFVATCAQAGSMSLAAVYHQEHYAKYKDIEALRASYAITKALISFGEQKLSSYTSEENKLILFRLGASKMMQQGIAQAFELYQLTDSIQYMHEAFFYAERSKSTLLLNALKSRDSIHFGQIPTAYTQEEQTLKKQIVQLQHKLLETDSESKQQEIKQRLNKANRVMLSFKEKLQKEYPAYHRHYYKNKLASLSQVQKSLAPGSLLLEYALANGELYVFALSNQQKKWYKLTLKEIELNRLAASLRKNLSDYQYINKQKGQSDATLASTAHRLYETLLQPILEDYKSAEQLLIIPDAILGHLPFEVFLTSKATAVNDYVAYPYLLKSYTINYAYSANLFTEQVHQQAHRAPKNNGVLAFAASYPKQKGYSLPSSSTRSARLRSLREGLSPLPGAQKEVQSLQHYLLGAFFTNKEADESNFKQKAKDYNIIHLAMHGILNPEEPLLSSLAFSDNAKQGEDNFLHAYEISNLNLNASLVVLSACETGYGKFRQGEGIMSLAHSFMYSGASSVLMSLWQVNDYSTGEIMRHYYTALAQKTPKDEAIRKAKLNYLEAAPSSQAAHPAYWAAFVPVGDNKAITLYCKSGWTFDDYVNLSFIFGATLLVLVAIWWRLKK